MMAIHGHVNHTFGFFFQGSICSYSFILVSYIVIHSNLKAIKKKKVSLQVHYKENVSLLLLSKSLCMNEIQIHIESENVLWTLL